MLNLSYSDFKNLSWVNWLDPLRQVNHNFNQNDDDLSNSENENEEYTPKLFSEEQHQESIEKNDSVEDAREEQLFDQDNNEDEDFEIPAFLRRQKF